MWRFKVFAQSACLILIYLVGVIIISSGNLIAQDHEKQQVYHPVTDSLVADKLAQWQDMKFGLLMHWGPYSQWGIVESWSICPEEYGWCERKEGQNPDDYNKYVQEYENLKTTFNPVDFNPDRWAKAAYDAGMKYVVFTTKHHDGFCMFDTQLTDYKITDEECPFSSNKKSDVTKEIFNAFRKYDFWTGTYFSKPDWHSHYYWDPYYSPRDRNVNYDPVENPEKWQKFVDFTHGQIMELMTNYGDVDILWLDGGWVAKHSKDEILQWYEEALDNSESGYLKQRMVNQDILMDELVEKARKAQPGLIVVDRAVEGPNQNYLTPENRVPDEPLPFPWESCIISGGGWSHTKDARYMNGREGIKILIEIVSKGGNLLLNIAPTPSGTWQQGAYGLLDEYAQWMDVNGSAIYGSKPMFPYYNGEFYFLSGKYNEVYCFYELPLDDVIADTLIINDVNSDSIKLVSILGYPDYLKWFKDDNSIGVVISDHLKHNLPSSYFVTLKLDK